MHHSVQTEFYKRNAIVVVGFDVALDCRLDHAVPTLIYQKCTMHITAGCTVTTNYITKETLGWIWNLNPHNCKFQGEISVRKEAARRRFSRGANAFMRNYCRSRLADSRLKIQKTRQENKQNR